MKKVSKRVQSTKLNKSKYSSLNGNMLKKIKGGAKPVGKESSTDNACYHATGMEAYL